MIICIQMVPFAFLIRWAYSIKAYRLGNDNSGNMKLGDGDSETGNCHELLSIPAMSRKNWQTQRNTHQGGRWVSTPGLLISILSN